MPASVGSTGSPAASAPAVQRLPDDGGPTAASGAGSAEATGALPTAPLAGQTSMPMVSRVTDDGPAREGAAPEPATASAPELPPVAGSVARPAVQRSATARDVAAASTDSSVWAQAVSSPAAASPAVSSPAVSSPAVSSPAGSSPAAASSAAVPAPV